MKMRARTPSFRGHRGGTTRGRQAARGGGAAQRCGPQRRGHTPGKLARGGSAVGAGGGAWGGGRCRKWGPAEGNPHPKPRDASRGCNVAASPPWRRPRFLPRGLILRYARVPAGEAAREEILLKDRYVCT